MRLHIIRWGHVMSKKDEIKDMGSLEKTTEPAQDMGSLDNSKPTKTVDLGRLNLPKFKKWAKFNKGK